MARLQVDRDAMRRKHGLEGGGDLVAHTLLYREAASEYPHQAGELGDANDVLVGDIANIGPPEEGQCVVLAERVELDRPLDDLAQMAVGLAAALRLEDSEHLGVALVAIGAVV